jgi:hypothetical protein
MVCFKNSTSFFLSSSVFALEAVIKVSKSWNEHSFQTTNDSSNTTVWNTAARQLPPLITKSNRNLRRLFGRCGGGDIKVLWVESPLAVVLSYQWRTLWIPGSKLPPGNDEVVRTILISL